MNEILTLEAAQQQLLGLAKPLESETIETHLAHGRYLAKDIVAARTQPAHDLSAMDGYATCGKGPWQIIGESRAGLPFGQSLESGEAVRISTGAWMPHGSDRVLIQENAALEAGNLSSVCGTPKMGEHIRRAGFDFAINDTLMERGRLVDAPQIALALSAGQSHIEVTRRPRLTLIEGGDELARSAQNCPPHQIPASNNAMIAALAAPLVSATQLIGPVPDTMSSMISVFERAEAAEVIVTSGGASVGDHDLVRPALEAWGAEITFWKIAMKPGKPLLVARKYDQIIIGLPGNPVSSFVTAFLFLLPMLRHLAGARFPLPMRLNARSAIDIEAGGPRREFLRAIWDGSQIAPIEEQDSSALLALSKANAIIERPEHCDRTKAGTDVPFHLL